MGEGEAQGEVGSRVRGRVGGFGGHANAHLIKVVNPVGRGQIGIYIEAT